MTLAEILKPSLTVLGHAEVKGLEIGAGLGAAVCVPGLWIHAPAVNAADDPPLVAVAKCAGVGALAGAGFSCALAAIRMCRLDADGIRERARKIRANEEQHQLDRVALAGAGVGLALVALRVGKIADSSNASVGEVALSKATAWEAFCFSVLGAAVGVGAVTVGKVIVKKMKKAGEEAEEVPVADEGVAKDAAEAVEQAATEAATATEEKAAEIVDSVKGAIETPAE